MSAEDNLSQELFFKAHRGLSNTKSNQISKENLGMHWSANRNISNLFAAHPDIAFGDSDLRSHNPSSVIHADIPLSSVETHTPTLEKGGVFEGVGEDEVPVKKGSSVKVTGLTHITWPSKVRARERKRTYTPPREMKA